MRLTCSASSAAIAISLFASTAVHAQDAPAPQQSPEEEQPEASASTGASAADTILVLGAALAKQVDTEQPPILELEEEDIAAYGVGSIAELLQALGPQIASARGRGGNQPVILVNGERIGSFREIRGYPPEAIEKFEIFPEEVALEYGYSADQRVVNIILKDNFSSRELEAEYGQPFDGGFSTQEVEATFLTVNGPSRLNINLGWDNSTTLTEAERGIIQSGNVPDLATDPDPAEYRSLRSNGAGLEATVNWGTRIGQGKTISLNATYERDDTLRLQGIDTVLLTDPGGNSLLRSLNADDPLTIDSRTQNFSAAASMNIGLGAWELSTTVDATHSKSNSAIQRRADTSELVAAAAAGTLAIDGDLGSIGEAGFDTSDSNTNTVSALATLRGNPIVLPAGDVSMTFNTGYNWNRIESEDTRNLINGPTTLKRGDLSAGINLGIPLTSSYDDVLGAVGDISLNASLGVNDLSDFGTLFDWTVGLTWGMGDNLTLTLTHFDRDAAPSLGQLGNPELQTLNVPIFDLVNNETVLATVISGGNPDLPAQNQSDWRASATYNPHFWENSTFSIEYIRNKSTDVAQGFPTLTPDIEAAFSDRITRDASGRLIQIDQRTVTYAEQNSERLQFNFNLSGEIGGGSDEEESEQRTGDNPAANGSPVALAGGALPENEAPASRTGGGMPAGAAGGIGGAQGAGAGRFLQMRQMICEAESDVLLAQLNAILAGEQVEGLTIPPQMLQRLAGDDGEISEEELGTIRSRMCSGEAPGGFGVAGGTGGFALPGGFAGQGGFGEAGAPGAFPGDPERMEQARATFCAADPDQMRNQFNRVLAAFAAGETITAEESGEAITIPPAILQQIGGEDNFIDEEEFAQIRTNICDPDASPAAGQESADDVADDTPASRETPPSPQPERSGGFVSRGGATGQGGPGGGGFRRGPGGGGPPVALIMGRASGRGNPGGRWFMNVQYRLELENEVLIAPGLPVLDLLKGDGNQSRHSGNARIGMFFDGFGTMWNARYTGKSTLNGTGGVGSTDLTFGDYVRIDVRVFADLSNRQGLIEAVPFLDNTRISLSIDNIFDARQRVTDSNGDVPLRYQPFLIDPVGRSFEIEFRKMF